MGHYKQMFSYTVHKINKHELGTHRDMTIVIKKWEVWDQNCFFLWTKFLSLTVKNEHFWQWVNIFGSEGQKFCLKKKNSFSLFSLLIMSFFCYYNGKCWKLSLAVAISMLTCSVCEKFNVFIQNCIEAGSYSIHITVHFIIRGFITVGIKQSIKLIVEF